MSPYDWLVAGYRADWRQNLALNNTAVKRGGRAGRDPRVPGREETASAHAHGPIGEPR